MPSPAALPPLLILLALGIAGCSSRVAIQGESGEPRHHILITHSPAESDELRGQIVVSAITQSGKNYRYGGNGPEDFDCSGLVRYVYSQVGITVPRTTLSLFNEGEPVKLADARPADLLFYRFEDSPGPPSHVMIYIGNGEAIHAPAGGKVVRSAHIDSAGFRKRFMGARRMMD